MIWFHRTTPAPGITQTTEPCANDYFRANFYTVHGRDADLQFDFGLGLSPFRATLPASDKPILAVASHAHVDHVGAFHEYQHRLGHHAEAQGFATMSNTATLCHVFRDQTYGPAVTQAPSPGFDIADWALTPTPLTATLAEGDKLDLGNRSFTVLHLPGHSPGSIALFDEQAGLLLAGDAIYDDRLLDTLPGSSIPDYLRTMERLTRFDCALVLAGHGDPFGPDRLHEIAQSYIRAKQA